MTAPPSATMKPAAPNPVSLAIAAPSALLELEECVVVDVPVPVAFAPALLVTDPELPRVLDTGQETVHGSALV